MYATSIHRFLHLIIAFSLLSFNSHADILSANQSYQNQQYQQALNQYKHLAKLGNNQARYQLASMYLKGHGVSVNTQLAFAWASLLSNQSDVKNLTLMNDIKTKLKSEDLAAAQQQAQLLAKQFADDVVLSQVAPIEFIPSENKPTSNEYHLTVKERQAPRYPRSELIYGTQGWVRVDFEVYPDGSARNFFIKESVPEGVFDEVTIEAVQAFRFQVDFNADVAPYPINVSQLIQFDLRLKDKPSVAKMYQQRLDELKQLAEDGHPTAQYYYALAASSRSMIKDHVNLDDVSVNEWLLKAAQNGNADAQYQLGYNILTGKGCQVEKQKGINWIVYAAQQGHAKAARQAYQQLTQNKQLKASDKPPQYWLKQAADHGDPEAQLDYAQYLSQAPESTQAEVKTIEKYLDLYLKERDKSVKYYLVSAQMYRLLEHDKKAKKYQKKAEKLAKKLGWEI